MILHHNLNFSGSLVSLLLAGLFLAGCATTQVLPKVTDERPTAAKALIVVEGSPAWAGMIKLYAIKVYDNKALVGSVAPNGKLVWLRQPGPVDISFSGGEIGRRFTVAAGASYHCKIECTANMIYSVAGPGIAYNDITTRASQPSISAPGSSGLGGQMDAMLRNVGNAKITRPDGRVIQKGSW